LGLISLFNPWEGRKGKLKLKFVDQMWEKGGTESYRPQKIAKKTTTERKGEKICFIPRKNKRKKEGEKAVTFKSLKGRRGGSSSKDQAEGPFMIFCSLGHQRKKSMRPIPVVIVTQDREKDRMFHSKRKLEKPGINKCELGGKGKTKTTRPEKGAKLYAMGQEKGQNMARG